MNVVVLLPVLFFVRFTSHSVSQCLWSNIRILSRALNTQLYTQLSLDVATCRRAEPPLSQVNWETHPTNTIKETTLRRKFYSPLSSETIISLSLILSLALAKASTVIFFRVSISWRTWRDLTRAWSGSEVGSTVSQVKYQVELRTNLREVWNCKITNKTLVGPSPGWKWLLLFSHLRHY